MIEGKFTDGKKLYLRQHLGEGKIEKKKFSFSLNANGAHIFIEFENAWAIYSLEDMIKDAYEQIFVKKVKLEE